MRAHETILFEKCPLCGQAKITIEKPRFLPFSKPKIDPCPVCSAEFAPRSADSYQLVSCEPHKLVGRHNCRDRIFRGCYLDATLSRLEWQKIAEGGESDTFSRFLEMSTEFSCGRLPTYPSQELPFALERGEFVHSISSTVYLGEQKSSKAKTSDKGELCLTNRRIVFVYPLGTLNTPLENVERVEDTPPGFLVKVKDSFEPLYFFPPPYDPISSAVRGAIYNLKSKS